uniref:Uncharacterized protein n=1 Tax=Poecilia reticulata TaxID=8081 RepID=A0A3P9MS26_POERE
MTMEMKSSSSASSFSGPLQLCRQELMSIFVILLITGKHVQPLHMELHLPVAVRTEIFLMK